MHRRLTSKEFVAIFKVLNVSRSEFARMLGFSEGAVCRTMYDKNYKVSARMDFKVKQLCEKLGGIEFVLDLARKGGHFNERTCPHCGIPVD